MSETMNALCWAKPGRSLMQTASNLIWGTVAGTVLLISLGNLLAVLRMAETTLFCVGSALPAMRQALLIADDCWRRVDQLSPFDFKDWRYRMASGVLIEGQFLCALGKTHEIDEGSMCRPWQCWCCKMMPPNFWPPPRLQAVRRCPPRQNSDPSRWVHPECLQAAMEPLVT